jgi:methionine aminotransferase
MDRIQVSSKLPQVGTTIFTVMSAMAVDFGAINLSQGFPDFAADPALTDRVAHYLRHGGNQYAPMPGTLALRKEIARLQEAMQGVAYDPEKEVTITSGATEGLFSSIMALIREGDEVIVAEPAYDSYIPAIEMAGGSAVTLAREYPDFRWDWEKVRRLIRPETRAIILNSPHNPTGAVWQPDDLEQLASLVRGKEILLISDEVYEHMVFDGRRHLSPSGVPELFSRTLVVGSFGKTFHTTGWKVGYVLGPENLTREIRKVHQFVTFSTSHPFQLALADHLAAGWDSIRELSAFYQQKRDFFLDQMKGSAFEPLPCAGSYFQLMSYAGISQERDMAFTERMVQEAGVAAIPVSVFYRRPLEQQVVRFCFAKNEDTLAEAAKRLKAWAPGA